MPSNIRGEDNFDSANRGVGIGQTWQDMTAQRASGVDYVNDTDTPITVAVTGSSTSSTTAGWFIFVDGVQIWGIASAGAGTTYPGTQLVIPVGSTYKLGSIGSLSIVSWFELRGD